MKAPFLFFYRTKIFIRFPKTLFATEDALEVRKHSLGMSHIQMHILSNWMVCCAPQLPQSVLYAQLPNCSHPGKATVKKPNIVK